MYLLFSSSDEKQQRAYDTTDLFSLSFHSSEQRYHLFLGRPLRPIALSIMLYFVKHCSINRSVTHGSGCLKLDPSIQHLLYQLKVSPCDLFLLVANFPTKSIQCLETHQGQSTPGSLCMEPSSSLTSTFFLHCEKLLGQE